MSARSTLARQLGMSLALAAAACNRTPPPDAYGNVEAIDVTVSAEGSGRIVSFEPVEGAALGSQAVVGTIDTSELMYQRDQMSAERGANTSRVQEIARQIDVLEAQGQAATARRDAARAQLAALEAQLDIARRTQERTERLFSQQAATAQQRDQAERDTRVLEQQIKAQQNQIAADEGQITTHTRQARAVRAQQQTASAQVAVVDARTAQVDERIRKSQIVNPLAGTVLATYVRAGEYVQQGQPLYKIADLDSVEVRAYITEPQLAEVLVGAEAQVSVDAGPGAVRTLTGTVIWIASQAEFTPTPIQTREERADLVYAIKIRVKNDGGVLKIGMPADVDLGRPAPPQ